MVADYFALIETEKSSFSQELPPITASLVDILKGADIKEEDYKAYLEDKHLT
jgi:hypothetical protein